MSMCILQEVVQSWPPHFCPTDAMIHVFLDNFVALLPRKLTEFETLGFWMLVNRGYSQV